MKKYIINVPDEKSAVFEEFLKDNGFVIFAGTDEERKAAGIDTSFNNEEDMPWIEAQKLIQRDAT